MKSVDCKMSEDESMTKIQLQLKVNSFFLSLSHVKEKKICVE